MYKQYGFEKWIRHQMSAPTTQSTTPDDDDDDDDDVAIGNDVRNGEWVVGVRDGVRQTHETGVPGGVRGTKCVAHARVTRVDYHGVCVGIHPFHSR